MLTKKNKKQVQNVKLYTFFPGVEPSLVVLRAFIFLLYQPWMIDYDDCGAVSGINDWPEKLKYSGTTCLSASLATTDSTRDFPSLKSGLLQWEASD
jgi:hypothetical protein